MAGLDALSLYKMQAEGGDAWGSYLKLCAMGGRYGYFETLEKAGIPMPLDAEMVKSIAAFAEHRAMELREKTV